jgi:hypothetical protein
VLVDIPLTNSPLVALIDEEDFSRVGGYNWQLNHHTVVNIATSTICGKPVMMHHLILVPKLGFEIDHRDNNGLHNWRDNLRYATHAQNCASKSMMLNNTSGYRGVFWDARRGKFYSKLCIKYRQMYLGNFRTAEAAARAYNEAALKHLGEFAKLNLIPEEKKEEYGKSSESR